ncbi:hypothetical protein QR90_04885 [Deinococcus radiopugnans]|uniref:Uncharacterized protein n=1 Tax=Deinococcus radiopugnans TaxID=57497 RepID=A0A0A7KEG5_9DEIO|nr:hypothetical protein [Deinococcus radiopugnans]AIZ44567.1 hypothetical protein QR90_04885 [Deinococcus radiopugnans]
MSDAPLDVSKLLQSILRHDRKLNTFKMALIRALNDTALNFAALHGRGHGVAVPLRVIAEWWLGYYWPFMDADQPVMQGPCVIRDGKQRQDVAFRHDLTELKALWRQTPFGSNRPSDGAVLVSEMKGNADTPAYTTALHRKYAQTLRIMAKCVEQPITYSGGSNEQYAVFSRQKRLDELSESVVALPGSALNDLCIVIPDAMWVGWPQKLDGFE